MTKVETEYEHVKVCGADPVRCSACGRVFQDQRFDHAYSNDHSATIVCRKCAWLDDRGGYAEVDLTERMAKQARRYKRESWRRKQAKVKRPVYVINPVRSSGRDKSITVSRMREAIGLDVLLRVDLRSRLQSVYGIAERTAQKAVSVHLGLGTIVQIGERVMAQIAPKDGQTDKTRIETQGGMIASQTTTRPSAA